MEHVGYIYETTNLINNKKYIGKRQSAKFQPYYYGSGIKIREAVKKYGKENFKIEILKWCNSIDELCVEEINEIKRRNAYLSEDYYNISAGGEGGNTYAGKTEEEMEIIKQKISSKNRGDNNGNHGQYIGERNSMYNKQQSDSARRQISESNKARLKTPGAKSGKHPWTPEMTKKRQETLKRYNKLWKIINKNTGETIVNYSQSKMFIKIFFPDIFNNITKFDWNTLKLKGVIDIDYITIERILIDTYALDEKTKNLYESYASECKVRCNDYRKHKLEEISN